MKAEEYEQQLQKILAEPSPKEAFFELCDLYCVASEKLRNEIRADFDYGRSWEAPNHRTLAAHLPNEPDREKRIRASLIALSFMDFSDDRDTIVWVCVLYHSIKSIGKDADAWFRYFADMSTPYAASHLFSFASRTPELKSLSAFGWEPEVTEQGLVFKGW